MAGPFRQPIGCLLMDIAVLKYKASIVVGHEFADVVEELLFVVLLVELDAVDFVDLAVPEVAHHRVPPLLPLYYIHHLLLHYLHLQVLIAYFDRHVRLLVVRLVPVEEQVQKVIHCDGQVAILLNSLFALARGAALDVELLEQDDSGVEVVVMEPVLGGAYWLM